MIYITDVAPWGNQTIVPYYNRLVSKYNRPSTDICVVADDELPF